MHGAARGGCIAQLMACSVEAAAVPALPVRVVAVRLGINEISSPPLVTSMLCKRCARLPSFVFSVVVPLRKLAFFCPAAAKDFFAAAAAQVLFCVT